MHRTQHAGVEKGEMLMMARRAFVALLVVLAAAAVPVAASASPPETETTVVKDTDTFVDVLPFCEDSGPLYEITIDYVLVEHSTESAAGAHFHVHPDGNVRCCGT
jgi:hypothetical protein